MLRIVVTSVDKTDRYSIGPIKDTFLNNEIVLLKSFPLKMNIIKNTMNPNNCMKKHISTGVNSFENFLDKMPNIEKHIQEIKIRNTPKKLSKFKDIPFIENIYITPNIESIIDSICFISVFSFKNIILKINIIAGVKALIIPASDDDEYLSPKLWNKKNPLGKNIDIKMSFFKSFPLKLTLTILNKIANDITIKDIENLKNKVVIGSVAVTAFFVNKKASPIIILLEMIAKYPSLLFLFN